MELVKNTPNWIKVDDDDDIPPTAEWDFGHLCTVMENVLFQLHSCGKYTLNFRAEIILRREGTEFHGQEYLTVEVECPRDGEHLLYTGNLERLDNLPVQAFTVSKLEQVVQRDV